MLAYTYDQISHQLALKHQDYPQQAVMLGSSPERLVMCSFTTSSAVVGWIPMDDSRVARVRPPLQKGNVK